MSKKNLTYRPFDTVAMRQLRDKLAKGKKIYNLPSSK